MDAFIYAKDGFGRALDEVEDALEQALGSSGEVTGSGTGERGSNIDLEIFDATPPSQLVADLRRALELLDVQREVVVTIDGARHFLIPAAGSTPPGSR